MTSPIPTDALISLKEAFDSKPDALARVIFFLADAAANGVADPYIRSLQGVISMPDVFKKVAERMAEDTKTAEKDPRYRQVMHDIWNNFMKDNTYACPDGGQRWSLAIPNDSVGAVVQFNFMRAVACLPPESYSALCQAVQAIGGTGVIAVYGERALATARSAKPIVRVALVAVYLAYDVIVNIRRWWKGEISGVRCVKNILDNGVSVAAGIAGGIGGEMLGAGIGALAGPVGMAVGAVVGAVAGGAAAASAAHALSDKLTQWMFGLPKSEALENAYNFLGTKASTSNSDINSCYRKLALKYHPDKGGDADKWTRLQYSMAVIREARGEY